MRGCTKLSQEGCPSASALGGCIPQIPLHLSSPRFSPQMNSLTTLPPAAALFRARQARSGHRPGCHSDERLLAVLLAEADLPPHYQQHKLRKGPWLLSCSVTPSAKMSSMQAPNTELPAGTVESKKEYREWSCLPGSSQAALLEPGACPHVSANLGHVPITVPTAGTLHAPGLAQRQATSPRPVATQHSTTVEERQEGKAEGCRVPVVRRVQGCG